MARSSLFLAIALFSFAAVAETPYPISGYVTAIQASGTFDVAGVHVRLTPTTEFRSKATPSATATTPVARPDSFFVGEPLDAIGQFNRSSHTVTAASIVLIEPTEATVHGTAIIDLTLPALPSQAATQRTVRADGFLLRFTEKTRLNFTAPLTSLADISTNQWIDYSGVQQLDGTVLLDYAGVGPNRVDGTDTKLTKKTEYDPAAVRDDSHQSGISKAFLGVDPRRTPPYHDPEMQARVERIGASLIPAYQRSLPDAAPTKIHFRFQVIDSTKWRDAVTMASGVIVVPRQVVDRMQNDSQLATVLADNIAEAIEKDARRTVTVGRRVFAADIAGDVVGAFVPGAGLATDLTGGGVAAHLRALQLQQSGRVSLDFLHDAGYDIAQAPLAWWLLAPKKPGPMDQVAMPPRAITLYIALGTTWHAATASAQ
jgi:hypothetical protein